MANIFGRYTAYALGLVWMLLSSASVLAESKFYRLELGAQAGGAYYMGELAPYAFMSMSETYGLQTRCKITERWALQVKGQRQRVINNVKSGNDFGLPEARYQTSMWHFDVTAEYNFFRFGTINGYNIRMHPVTPFIFVGLGMTAHNPAPSTQKGFPLLGWKERLNQLTQEMEMVYLEPDFAMYIPVGVGLKWKFAERWQLQLAWQHQLYVLNGDGLEGNPKSGTAINPLDNSYDLNGVNILNNDVTSTITIGVVFEFAPDKKICVQCRER